MSMSLRLGAFVRDVTTGEMYGFADSAVTATGSYSDGRTMAVGTSEYTWTLATDVGSANLCVLWNRDTTNYVEYGFSTGVYVGRLLPGQANVIGLQPTQASLFLRANTATCKVLGKVFEA